jgi:hypothetical protein
MDLKGEILKRQKEDPFIVEEIRRIDEGRKSMFELWEENSLWFQNRICVGTPAYRPEFPLCIQFMIPGDRRESI